MEVVREYWIFMNETDILGVFETLQECLEWKPMQSLSNPRILRMKKRADGSFTSQTILVNAEMYR